MDMVVLAHIKEQSRLSLGSYGRPRMTGELKEVGVNVGHPLPGSGLLANRERGRVGRLMGETGIIVERTRKFKVEEDEEMIRGIISPTTTDSEHRFTIAPNLLDRDFTADQPNQKCPLMVCRQTIAG